MPVDVAEHLIARYGSLATELLDLIRADRMLGQPLLGGFRYLRAEVAYAVSHEGALHVEDVLARRVRLLIESPDAGASAAPEVVAIMAGLLGWNRRRRAIELRRYQDFAAANAAALTAPAPLPDVESAAIPALQVAKQLDWLSPRPARLTRADLVSRALPRPVSDVTFFRPVYKRYISHREGREFRCARLGYESAPRNQRLREAPWTSTRMWYSAARSSGCSSG